MKTRLLFSDRDLEANPPAPPQGGDLVRDLQLPPVLGVMAGSDSTVEEVCRAVVLNGLTDHAQIRYRQEVLRDCLTAPSTIRRLYQLAVHTVAGERHVFHSLFRRHPVAVLQQVVETLALFSGTLHQLRRLSDGDAARFRSPGLTRFFEAVRVEFDDAFLADLDRHLEMLRFRRGQVLDASLGPGNAVRGGTLLRPPSPGASMRHRLRRMAGDDGYSFEVDPRDEVAAAALARLRERALTPLTDALAPAIDRMLAFFTTLRRELAFYVGCLNLADCLAARGAPTCFPELAEEPAALSFSDLRDLPLLVAGHQVTGNDLCADGRPLIVVTGANQGGKSTFLRSLGVAQLLLQAGLFVPARRFRSSPAPAIFTHYPREEDATMERGHLDEELRRMSEIADRAVPGALVLSNESFAATNEREGSEIGWQVVAGMTGAGVRVAMVTHLFELTSRLERERPEVTRFLRAPRQADGRPAFRLEEGSPLPTGYAEDRYRVVFGEETRGTG
ncbi:MAG: DNA mismatch repair protein MutS [Candidatus Dormibacteraeota bacterium]|nr:DNA mismatch repair protein MutS [Candidatus Dormibacteraeota bacterium]